MATETVDQSESKRPDVSWKGFFVCWLLFDLAAYFFDEKFRPMVNVDPTEKVLWYSTYGATFLLIPGAVVYLLYQLGKRRGTAFGNPKRKTIYIGAALMVFTLFSTARHLAAQ